MTPETKNLIAAMSLSLAILIGWQLYFVEPQLEAERAAAQLAAQQVAEQQPVRSGGLNADGTPRLASDAAEAPETDNQDIDKGTRLVIDGPLIAGSISTMGARLDDIVLTSYFETQEEGSRQLNYYYHLIVSSPILLNLAGWPMGRQILRYRRQIQSGPRQVLLRHRQARLS